MLIAPKRKSYGPDFKFGTHAPIHSIRVSTPDMTPKEKFKTGAWSKSRDHVNFVR